MTQMITGAVAGVDVGGTFTDLVVRDARGFVVAAGKAPTTTGDESKGVIDAFEAQHVDVSQVDVIVHGTTVATNALIEGPDVRTALITTEGFRDVIELRNRHRPHMYGLTGTFEPLIPRDRRFEVRERTGADGSVVKPVDREEVTRVIEEALPHDIEAIAIGFLHAYVNPEHERVVEAWVRDSAPHLYVCTSHAVNTEVREFERFSTLAANAALMPLVSRYLRRLDERLRALGFAGQLLVVQSNGGVTDIDHAAQTPVNLVRSGPAAGVSAALELVAARDLAEFVSFDMGGTSLDLSIIRDGKPRHERQAEPTYGMPLRVQMIDVVTAGAGGGSIATLDERGILQVGPHSAGAVPGPACYGRGGQQPTVTDANVVLGRLGQESSFGGGSVRLDPQAAATAIDTQLAPGLNMDAVAAADAILQILATNVAGQIRRITVDEGFDPRGMGLLCFGGAGGLHASPVLQELELCEVVIPPMSGVLSAVGCMTSDFRHDFAQGLLAPLADLSADALERLVGEHIAEGRRMLEREAVADESVSVEVHGDMQYQGQTHTLLVPLEPQELSPAALKKRFESEYVRRFGNVLDTPITLMTLRTAVIGRRAVAAQTPATPSDADPRPSQTRPVYAGGSWHPTPLYARATLPAGWQSTGPLIITDPDTTVFVEPGLTLEVSDHQHLLIRRQP